jgi:hypothetical protein
MSWTWQSTIKMFQRTFGILQAPGFGFLTAGWQKERLGFTSSTSAMTQSEGLVFSHVP